MEGVARKDDQGVWQVWEGGIVQREDRSVSIVQRGAKETASTIDEINAGGLVLVPIDVPVFDDVGEPVLEPGGSQSFTLDKLVQLVQSDAGANKITGANIDDIAAGTLSLVATVSEEKLDARQVQKFVKAGTWTQADDLDQYGIRLFEKMDIPEGQQIVEGTLVFKESGGVLTRGGDLEAEPPPPPPPTLEEKINSAAINLGLTKAELVKGLGLDALEARLKSTEDKVRVLRPPVK